MKRTWYALFAAAASLAVAMGVGTWRDADFWSTPEVRGDRLFAAGRFADAARAYADPYRSGIAWYRAGDFQAAAAALAVANTAEAAYDRANSLVMLGKYDDAIAGYDRALALRSGWREAADNRAVAVVRRDRLKTHGGDETGGQVKADEIEFDPGKKSGGEETEVDGGPPLSDEALRGLWLRRVQTKPADFLRAKFAFQVQAAERPKP